MRSTAAFALGALGDEKALQRLNQMLVDANPNVRYNAATMLASHGSMAAEPVLLEMLDSKSTVGLDIEEEKDLWGQKRETILVSALRAVKKLAATKHPAAEPEQAAARRSRRFRRAHLVSANPVGSIGKPLKDLDQRSPQSAGSK